MIKFSFYAFYFRIIIKTANKITVQDKDCHEIRMNLLGVFVLDIPVIHAEMGTCF